jgi:hypothetical protein
MLKPESDLRSRTVALLCAVALLLIGIWLPITVAAMPLRMRYPEGLTRGFLNLSTTTGQVLAHGELTQWFEGRTLASRLTFHFDDGSLYDERERFSRHPGLRDRPTLRSKQRAQGRMGKYLEQTRTHEQIVLNLLEILGLDPAAETPGRSVDEA